MIHVQASSTVGEITFDWAQENFGFGMLTIGAVDGQVFIGNEGMTKDRVRALMHAWVDAAVDAAELEDNDE